MFRMVYGGAVKKFLSFGASQIGKKLLYNMI